MSDSRLLDSLKKLKRLIRIGIELSAQRDHETLMEEILLGAKDLTNADGGTLYTVTPDHTLRFNILRTDSLRLHLGGSSGNVVSLPEIPLFDVNGKENLRTVVTYSVHRRSPVNIDDVYKVLGFDFSGTRDFDARTGYRTRSLLTVPMKNHAGTVIGVLQLLNPTDRKGAETIFTQEDQDLVEALASQAAMSMCNQRLIKNLNEMLEGFIQAIAKAIDEKSPHTGDHCRKVPMIAGFIAEAVNESQEGPFAHFRFTDEELYELQIASLLHDCGKVSTPVHLIDKAKRLETIVDRQDWILERFEILRRDVRLSFLEGKCSEIERDARLSDLDADAAYVVESNDPAVFMSEDRCEQVRKIAKQTWVDAKGNVRPILTDDELQNLCIAKGTLNEKERREIEKHASLTLDLLESLTYPEHLSQVPEIAGGHHERMNGLGYPKGLKGNELSLRARILAIADVFEALTSSSRPYKKAIPMERVIEILQELSDEQHLDPDLCDVFIRQRVYERYQQSQCSPAAPS